jgi:hypothetical protein
MSDVQDEDAAGKPTPVKKLKEKREGYDRVELFAAIMLGIAGALTAFSAYKAALTDGDALKGYTESAKSTSDANSSYDDYSQTYYADQQLFRDYLVTSTQDPELAAGLRELFFDDNLEAATTEWESLPTDEQPDTALEVEAYQETSFDEYNEYTALAEEQFAEAAKADSAGDKFEQASVFLAISLFLAGVASLFKIQGVRYAALTLSALAVIPGVIAMLDGQNALG